jgi:hypothetical protein
MVKFDNLKIVEHDGYPPEPVDGEMEEYACFMAPLADITTQIPITLYYQGCGVFVDRVGRQAPAGAVVAWDTYSMPHMFLREAAPAAGPTEEKQESPWNIGHPDDAGEYYVKITKNPKNPHAMTKPETDFWDGEKWYFWSGRVVKWMPVPEDPEESA